jgi:hypothetical protein
MLRKSATTAVPEDVPAPKKPPTHEELVEERLDMILQYMHRFERRDRWRTYGGAVRNLIAIVPFILFLGSIWYVFTHGQDLMKMMADEAAKSAANYTQQKSQGFLDQFKGYLPGGGQASSARN